MFLHVIKLLPKAELLPFFHMLRANLVLPHTKNMYKNMYKSIAFYTKASYYFFMKEYKSRFVWDAKKEIINIQKHGVDFMTAAHVFNDPKRKIYTDVQHSIDEPRLFCIGKVGEKIITVRFTYREHTIRIIGAGYWRKGIRYYEKKD